MIDTMRTHYAAPILRAFKQAPWRSQTQAVAMLSITLLTAAVVGGFYLAVAARAATAGRDLQKLEARKVELLQDNDELAAQLANLRSINRLATRAVPKLRANGGGSITLCTTIANRRVVDLDGLSPFSKNAVEAMVRQIAAEEAGSRIRCNSVAVSWVTPLSKDQQIAEMAPLPQPDRDLIVGVIEHMAAGTRMDRPQLPIECGYLFAFLASEQAQCITGQSVAFDGGFSL